MKIARLQVYSAYIGGASMHPYPETKIIFEVRGIVTMSEMVLRQSGITTGTILAIEISDQKERYFLQGGGIPRINIGEEIILHLGFNPTAPERTTNRVVAVQIVVNNETIFRAIMPSEHMNKGGMMYEHSFVD